MRSCEECGFAMPDGWQCQRCGNRTWVEQPPQPVRDPLGYRPTTPAEIDNTTRPGVWREKD